MPMLLLTPLSFAHSDKDFSAFLSHGAAKSSGSTDLRRAPQDERGQISQLSAAASQAASEQHAFDSQRIRAGALRFQADQACMSPLSKEKQYFLIGLSSSMKQQHAAATKNLLTFTHIKNSSSAAAMVQEPLEDIRWRTMWFLLHWKHLLQQSKFVMLGFYWGVCFGKPNDVGSKIWNSFWPSENRIIEAEVSIDINKHRNPENFSDQFARLAVMALRFPTDLLFRVMLNNHF
ncbi:hypothetical protein SELMODRAFT_429569 [Selaginella moellendorffii]|uniref:Uncharacterized protein n=1 Tax=Selaginella moellendorffii TaxID=88036 RepID=D8T6L5_SELML|nr:hypothetical protein SELMODRAFT_429569 [Selaginella moellendorffii]